MNEYYYLYKAYDSSGSTRKDHLYSSYRSDGGYKSKIYSLYEKQCNILKTEDEISNISSRNYSLKSENNNIGYQISNQRAYNDTKNDYNKTLREKVKGFLDKMNQLNKDMTKNIEKATKKSDDVIKTQKDTKEKIEHNVKEQEKFLKELEEIEKEKEKNIKEKKETNMKLQEQNKQYIMILKGLEEKLKNRLNKN